MMFSKIRGLRFCFQYEFYKKPAFKRAEILLLRLNKQVQTIGWKVCGLPRPSNFLKRSFSICLESYPDCLFAEPIIKRQTRHPFWTFTYLFFFSLDCKRTKQKIVTELHTWHLFWSSIVYSTFLNWNPCFCQRPFVIRLNIFQESWGNLPAFTGRQAKSFAGTNEKLKRQ